MKSEVKGFGRASRKNPGPDVRDRCGKLILTAENEADAAILTLIYRNLHGVGTKRTAGARIAMYLWMLDQVKGFEEPLQLKEMRPEFDEFFAKNPLPKTRKPRASRTASPSPSPLSP